MGKRGPPKTPTKILEARNSWRAKKRKHEPIPPDGDVVADGVLDAAAKTLFDRITKEIAAGVVKPCDSYILSMACQAFSDWVRLTRELRSEGDVVEGSENVIRNPKIAIRDKARDSFFRFARDYGLTPSSRTSLATDGNGNETDEAKLFSLKLA